MYALGAKSGERRRAILTYSRDGDDYVVAGTDNGAPRDPAWLANVRADPDVTIEIGRRSFEALASVAEGEERVRLWDQHVARLPWFADYPAQAGRRIPMVRLSPKPDEVTDALDDGAGAVGEADPFVLAAGERALRSAEW